MIPTGAVTLPKRRRIYLVRHGEVSYFDEQGKPFRPATVPLTAEGRHQAQALARELTEVALDRAVSSDLPRCTETAALLTEGRGLTVQTHEALREVEPGRLADLPAEGVVDAFLRAFGAGSGPETRFLGGETFGSLRERVLRCWRDLLADATWRHLLVVAHGGVNRVLLGEALGAGLSAFGALEQDPSCLNVIDVDESGCCLVRLVNHTPYDPAKRELQLTTMERLYVQYRGRR
jgi:probable phosphoglycerate mutase